MTDHSLIVLTGATSGIGLEAARALSQRDDLHLVVGARAPARCDALRSAVAPEKLTLLPLDTSSLASVRAFAAALDQARAGRPVCALALNAGMQGGPTLELTSEGHERTFATNYLGHYALVESLRTALAPGAAVVITASQSHAPDDRVTRLLGYRGAIFEGAGAVAEGRLDMTASPAQQSRDRYATSKFCCLLWTFAMARQTSADAIRFLAYDPGAVPGTSIVRELGLKERFGWTRVLPLAARIAPGFSTPLASGRALAQILSDQRTAAISGAYLDYRLQPAPLWEAARRIDWQEDLLAVSGQLARGPSATGKQP